MITIAVILTPAGIEAFLNLTQMDAHCGGMAPALIRTNGGWVPFPFADIYTFANGALLLAYRDQRTWMGQGIATGMRNAMPEKDPDTKDYWLPTGKAPEIVPKHLENAWIDGQQLVCRKLTYKVLIINTEGAEINA